MKRVFLLHIFLGLYSFGFSQDSTSSIERSSKRHLKAGLYYQPAAFWAGTPTLEIPFDIVPNYVIFSNDAHTISDTVLLGVMYRPLDTSLKTARYIFGFCDGKDMYIRHGEGYFKMGCIGRYASAIVQEYVPPKAYQGVLFVGSPLSLLVSAAGNAVAYGLHKKKATIKTTMYFFDREERFVEATPEKMRWFLEPDRDLSKAFFKRRHTFEVFDEFLVQMSDRYPIPTTQE